MTDRINEGYIITDSIHIGQTEFVLGKLDSKIPMFVTWACKGGDNYYWGHYFGDLMEAKKDLLSRAGEELECQRQSEIVDFRRNKMSFFGGRHSSVYSPSPQLHLPA